MNKNGLKFTFGKVEKDESEYQMLVGRRRYGGDGEGKVWVEIGAEGGPKKERVDQKRPDILDDEDITPADLGA